MFTQCNSPEQLETCLRNPGVLVPTFEFRLRTIDLPLDAQDLSYLSESIKVFADEQSVCATNGATARVSQSKNMEQPEYQLPADFIALGVCALAYVEPYGVAIDGNLFAYDQMCAVPPPPRDVISPDVWFNETQAWLGSNLDGAGAFIEGCPAQLDYGIATWKFVDWFFKTYRMSVGCQVSSNVHEVLNERLVDMGNCCIDTSKTGFSNTNGSIKEAVVLTNARMAQIAGTPCLIPSLGVVGLPNPSAHTLGQFKPINANVTQRFDRADDDYTVVPVRYTVQPQAFGGIEAAGAHRWFKFDVPRVIRAHRNIKITLEREIDDTPNWVRMIREGSVHICSNLSSCSPTLNEFVVGDHSYTARVRSTLARIPGGRIMIGIGLKGLLLDGSLCSDVEMLFNNMSAADAYTRYGWTGGPTTNLEPMTVMSGGLAAAAASCTTGACGG